MAKGNGRSKRRRLETTIRARIPMDIERQLEGDARRLDRSKSYVLRTILAAHYGKVEQAA